MSTWWLCGLLAWYGWLNMSAVPVWRSEASLWAHAYAVSPTAPRAAGNHAKFVRDTEEARRIVRGIRPSH